MSWRQSDPLRSVADPSAPLVILRRILGPFQHGVLAMTRSAGRLGIPVYCGRLSDREPATRSRYLTGTIDLPRGSSDEDWIEALIEFGRHHEGAVLLPVDDRAAVAVGDHQERLGHHFRLPLQPPGLQRRLASKRELWELCVKLGLPTPDSAFPTSETAVIDAAEAYGYPVVLKRAEPWFPPHDPNAPSVAIANTCEELLDAYERMESSVQPQVMVQDHIPGGSDSVWMFNGYFDARSEPLCAFTGRKLRQRGPRTGPTTLGVCGANATVADAAIRLLQELKYHGIVDMGFRYDARDGLYKLLDVNPRVGSTFRLFVSEAGVDVVRAMHLDLTGRPVPRSKAKDGRKWVDEPHDLGVALQLHREGDLDLNAWRRSLAGLDEGAWWASDDPAPYVAMVAGVTPHAGRLLKRRRGPQRGSDGQTGPSTAPDPQRAEVEVGP
jgi:D-aspartate ligase